MGDLLDVPRPASDDEVSKSSHFWIVDEGLLESFLTGWCYTGMMDSDIQWEVGAWPGIGIKRVCLVWPFPCLGSNGLLGHIPAGIASCIGAMQACLLGSFWIWIQAAYDLIWLWRTVHRCKCRITLLQRQLLASLSLCLHICILHRWVFCLQKLWVCCSVRVLP